MKKLSIILGLLIATTTLTFAEGFNVGVNAGLSMSNMSWSYNGEDPTNKQTDTDRDAQFGIGFKGGVTGYYGIDDNMGLSLGLMYSLKPGNYETKDKGILTSVGGGADTVNASFSTSWIDFPLYFHYQFGEGFGIYVGGYGAYKISQSDLEYQGRLADADVGDKKTFKESDLILVFFILKFCLLLFFFSLPFQSLLIFI